MLVVSLAALRGREQSLRKVLDSVLAQTRVPDRILVHYSEEPWHLDEGWPEPPKLQDHPAIELRRVPNVGSMRKYIHVAQELRESNALIVLLDDDRVWHPSVIERVAYFVERTDNVATTRGWSKYRLTPDASGQSILRAATVSGDQVKEPMRVMVPNSGWATCFRAQHVDERLFDPRLHAELDMRYSDEIALATMITRPKFVVPLPQGFARDIGSKVHQWLSPRSTQAKLTQLAWARRLHEGRRPAGDVS